MRRIFLISAVVLMAIVISGIYFIKNFETKFDFFPIQKGNILPESVGELQKMSNYKFYMLLVGNDRIFIRKYLAAFVEAVGKMHGLMEIVDPSDNLIFAEIFKRNNSWYKKLFSIVIITNRNAEIVGVYPNEQMHELIQAMQNHPDLINLDLAGTAL